MRRKLLVAILCLVTALAVIGAASAMKGQMKGQASLTGKLSNQTVKMMGSVFFEPGEDNAVVCLTLNQNGHKAYGCSKNLRNPGTASGEVQFPVTLTGSGLVYGRVASVNAVATYDEDGVPGDTYRWSNPGVTLVP